MDQQQQNITIFITAMGGVVSAMFLQWAKKNGLELDPVSLGALGTGVGMIVGKTTGWILAIVESFVGAVATINAAVANRCVQLINRAGGLAPVPKPESTTAEDHQ